MSTHSKDRDVTETLKKSGQVVKEQTRKLKDKAKKNRDVVKEEAYDAQTTLANYIKQNPLTSLAWSALAGAVLGALLRK